MDEPANRSNYPTRLRRLHDPDADRDDDAFVQSLTPGERMDMVWQLTLQAWAFKEGLVDEPRLRRDVVRVIRGAG
jgi:hypothetical protein